MIDLESRLTEHLAARAATAEPSGNLVAILEDIGPPQRSIRERRSYLVAAAAVVAIVVAGLIVLSGARDSGPSEPIDPPRLPPGVPANGAAWTARGSATISLAAALLTQDCMAAAGFEYDIDSAQLTAALESWSPHPVLGVVGEAGAAWFGYHLPDRRLIGGPDSAAALLREPERERFYEALMGGGVTDPTQAGPTIPLPDASGGGATANREGCTAEATDAVFAQQYDAQEALRGWLEGSPDHEAATLRSADDPRVRDALASWRACISNTTGLSAETPNELARRYAFVGEEDSTMDADATRGEIAVAVADARCQAQVGVQATWDHVFAEHRRALIEDHPDWFDALAVMRSDIVENAARLLDERGFEWPAPCANRLDVAAVPPCDG